MAQEKEFEEDDNTIALLHFDGDLENISDNENSGKIKGKPKFIDGVFGKAVSIEKPDQIIMLAEEKDELSIAGSSTGITVELWIKPLGQTGTICTKYTGGQYKLCIDKKQFVFIFYA